jgi:hypothetical protein
VILADPRSTRASRPFGREIMADADTDLGLGHLRRALSQETVSTFVNSPYAVRVTEIAIRIQAERAQAGTSDESDCRHEPQSPSFRRRISE